VALQTPFEDRSDFFVGYRRFLGSRLGVKRQQNERGDARNPGHPTEIPCDFRKAF
jgi:hypothetical protein